MIEKVKTLIKHTSIYGFGTALSMSISFILTPILTRNFDPANYGVIELIGNITAIISLLLVMGFSTSLGIYFYSTDNQQDKKEYISTALTYLLVTSAIFCSVLFLFADPLSTLFFKSTAYSIYLKFTFVALPFTIFLSVSFSLLRFLSRSVTFVVLSTVKTLLTISLTIFFLLYLKQGLLSVYYPILVVNAALAIVMFLVIKEYKLKFFVPEKLKRLLKVGIPLIPVAIFDWIMNLSDRFFLTHFRDLYDVGIYSVSIKVASFILLIVTVFQMAWGPLALSIARSAEAKEFYKKSLSYFVIIGCLGATILSLFGKEIITIFTSPDYVEAFRYVGPLSLSAVMYGAYSIVAIGVNITKKTQKILYSTATAAILNVILNLIFIARYGIWAAALSTFVSYAISMYLLSVISNKYYPVDYNLKKVTRILVLAIAIISLGYVLIALNLHALVLLRVGLIICYCAAIWFMNFISKDDKIAIKNIIRTRILRNRSKLV